MLSWPFDRSRDGRLVMTIAIIVTEQARTPAPRALSARPNSWADGLRAAPVGRRAG
jgi:hypothetical protein